MTSPPDDLKRRHSVAEAAQLINDPRTKAEAEARNGLRQFDLGLRIVEDAVSKGATFRWLPSVIQALHREALQEISEFA